MFELPFLMYRLTRRDFLKIAGTAVVAAHMSNAGEIQSTYATQLENVLSQYNHVLNPTFSQGGEKWELRMGAGQYGGNLGVIDEYNYHTFSGEKTFREHASVMLAPSDNAGIGIEDEGIPDRSIWPKERINCQPGDIIMLSCYAMFQLQGITRKKWAGINEAYLRGEGTPYWQQPPFWVNQKHIRDFKPCPPEYEDRHINPWADRGGARLGMDFRGAGFYDTMVIMDWSNEPEVWHHLNVEYAAPEGAITVMPWLQGFEHNAPATVWFDDICMFIKRNGTLVPR